MELCGSALQIVWPHVIKRLQNFRYIKKNMRLLREASVTLAVRKQDLIKRLDEELRGENEPVEEFKHWRDCVEKISGEVEEIGNKVERVKFCSRHRLGREVVEMKVTVDRLYVQGEFADGSLVKKIRQRGRELPTEMISGSQITKDEILRFLKDENVLRIGVYGMGGIGKTTLLQHVKNDLLKSDDVIGRNFDKVIWITASKESDVKHLQKEVADELELGSDFFNGIDGEQRRANMLYSEFKKDYNKRFVLIIDDMWNDCKLSEVGVPDPTYLNGCKLIVATRSLEVCSKMECYQNIKMGLLSVKEAEELFMSLVGQHVPLNPKLNELARQVARECACLPLAIVKVAGSMRCIMEPKEWEVALRELKDSMADMLTEVMTILRSSYDFLTDNKLKECLLYCALYSEGYLIERNLLIDQLVAEGIVDRILTEEHPGEKCSSILNKLVRKCLLIDMVESEQGEFVKLQDLIRDMAIQIMRESPRFLVEAGKEWKFLNLETKFSNFVEKISLTGGKSDLIVFSEPPKCPKLSTLFLNKNIRLTTIFNEFFKSMEGLCVLDLSNTNIMKLPNSVSTLANLAVLSVSLCKKLCYVPDLSRLTKLVRLDMYESRITEVPVGVEELTKLTHLDLGRTQLQRYPNRLFHKLSNLEYLSLVLWNIELVSVKELALTNLRTLKVYFEMVEQFQECVRLIQVEEIAVENFVFLAGSSEKTVKYYDNEVKNTVRLSLEKHCENAEVALIKLPDNVEDLRLRQLNKTSLCRLINFSNLKKLRRIKVQQAVNLKYLFCYSTTLLDLLQTIEELDLDIPELLGFIDPVGISQPLLPLEAFSSLKILTIHNCVFMKKLFVGSFPNLADIDIKSCCLLEEIISFESQDAMMDFPSLKTLKLRELDGLKTVQITANCLSTLVIRECLSLTKLILSSEENPFPPSLQIIEIDADPWKSSDLMSRN